MVKLHTQKSPTKIHIWQWKHTCKLGWTTGRNGSAKIGRGQLDGAEDLMKPDNVFFALCDSVPQLVRPKLRVTECEMAVRNWSICTKQTIFGGNKAALLHHLAERKHVFIRIIAQEQLVTSALKFSEKPATFSRFGAIKRRMTRFLEQIIPPAAHGKKSEASDSSTNINIFILPSSLTAPGRPDHAYSINKRHAQRSRVSLDPDASTNPRWRLFVLSRASRRARERGTIQR